MLCICIVAIALEGVSRILARILCICFVAGNGTRRQRIIRRHHMRNSAAFGIRLSALARGLNERFPKEQQRLGRSAAREVHKGRTQRRSNGRLPVLVRRLIHAHVPVREDQAVALAARVAPACGEDVKKNIDH
jgi:hypothetical protein